MIMKGTQAFTTCSKDTFAMSATKYAHIPTGGVRRPIIKFIVNNTPKWTLFIPKRSITGKRTGTKTTMAAVVSIKHPTKSNNKLMINNTIYLLEVTDKIRLVNCCGIIS